MKQTVVVFWGKTKNYITLYLYGIEHCLCFVNQNLKLYIYIYIYIYFFSCIYFSALRTLCSHTISRFPISTRIDIIVYQHGDIYLVYIYGCILVKWCSHYAYIYYIYLSLYIFIYNIAFVNSECWLAKSHVDITQCQHRKFHSIYFFVLFYKKKSNIFGIGKTWNCGNFMEIEKTWNCVKTLHPPDVVFPHNFLFSQFFDIIVCINTENVLYLLNIYNIYIHNTHFTTLKSSISHKQILTIHSSRKYPFAPSVKYIYLIVTLPHFQFNISTVSFSLLHGSAKKS